MKTLPAATPQQLDLFAAGVQPVARAGDPQTSQAAAASMREVAGRHQAIILAALRHGPASAEQLADRLAGALLEHQVGKRLGELERAGRIEPTGDVAVNRSGRRARIFRLVHQVEGRVPQSVDAAERPGDLALPADPIFGRGRGRWRR